MTSARKHIQSILLLCVLALTAGCGKHRQSSEGLEGKIVYDLSFPFEKNSVMLDLYPKEMVVYFKGDKLHSEIRSSYDLLTTDFIIDNKERTFTQLLKNVSKRTGMKLNEAETKQWHEKYPDYKFEAQTETTVMCGYVCNKTLAHVPGSTEPPVEIYHTRGTGLSTDNWWNPYSGVDGFLMAYDVEQYGMRMRLKVREIVFEHVDDAQFNVPNNYELTDAATLNAQLDAVVEEYVK